MFYKRESREYCGGTGALYSSQSYHCLLLSRWSPVLTFQVRNLSARGNLLERFSRLNRYRLRGLNYNLCLFDIFCSFFSFLFCIPQLSYYVRSLIYCEFYAVRVLDYEQTILEKCSPGFQKMTLENFHCFHFLYCLFPIEMTQSFDTPLPYSNLK